MSTACAVLEADLYFAMIHAWNPDMASASAMPKLNALAEAVRADALIAPILERHGL